MRNIAILGFGVVGGGVAALLTDNCREVEKLCKERVNIKHILDLRDFPDSPFANLITHSFDDILNDSEVDTVIEVMGGSHPAYEFTVSALKAGKNVITSNKEVVANFGHEFLSLAEKHGVSYRFEAAVGGGIPVISPIISMVRHNRISEVRGILNGTTNYILTKMFTYGQSFADSLADAQERGYAERNPDADILGTDAARKITILTALVTGKLYSPDEIYTEGITGIRSEDVACAEALGYKIKLLGRCRIENGKTAVSVSPFMLSPDSALASVSGVYNAVEVIGEPIGNVMFYGQGAGAGATASAVVGDLMQIIASARNCAMPEFEKCEYDRSFADSTQFENYIACSGADTDTICSIFGEVQFVDAKGEVAFITAKLSEKLCSELLSKLSELCEVRSRIRIL